MSAPEGFTETQLIDPYEIHFGPIYECGEKGARRFALRIDERHLNGRGVVHGATFMSFADAAFGQAAWDACDHAHVVTLNMQNQFLAAVRAGDLLEVEPVLVKRTRTMIFLRGEFTVAGNPVYSAASVWKILGPE